tara:strand:- start:1588 stop:1782 length:195 start_codon:yes stop_codon:yes gene_type:complete
MVMNKHETGMEDNEDSLANTYEQGLYNYMEIAKAFIGSDCTLEDLEELDKVLKEVLDEYFSKEE